MPVIALRHHPLPVALHLDVSGTDENLSARAENLSREVGPDGDFRTAGAMTAIVTITGLTGPGPTCAGPGLLVTVDQARGPSIVRQ